MVLSHYVHTFFRFSGYGQNIGTFLSDSESKEYCFNVHEMCAKGGKQVYVQRLAHINQGSLLQTILTVGNKWGSFFERKKIFGDTHCFGYQEEMSGK